MKILSKKCELDLTGEMGTMMSTSKFMQNIQVKSMFLLNHQELVLVRTSSLLVFNQQSSSIAKVINLNVQIDQVCYLPYNDMFYAYQVAEKQLISFTNESSPTIQPLYKYSQNKVNIQFEWAPWILAFQESSDIVLVRKLYGESVVIVFKTNPVFQKKWQFVCNESSISKMDQFQYLVNFDETNNRYSVRFTVYNCISKGITQYRIQDVEPNICKGVQLYKKIQKRQKNQENTWLKVVIGVNFKTNGSGILLINLLQGVNHHYELLSTITNRDSQINALLGTNIFDRSIQISQFRYLPSIKVTSHFFVNYKWSEFEDTLFITDDKQLQSHIENFAYDALQAELVTFTNEFNKKDVTSNQSINHTIKMDRYRLISKKGVYINLLQNYFSHPNEGFFNEVLGLL